MAKIIYVDDDAFVLANDGTSWQTAYPFLADALEASRAGDEIRIAQGTYRPDENALEPSGSGDRELSFTLLSDIVVRGGYAGGASAQPDERDTQRYKTILSGDLAENDSTEFINYEDNSYHLIVGHSVFNTVIEGLFVVGGCADREYQDGSGGGLKWSAGEGSPAFVLSDCHFERNYALREGGGCYLSGHFVIKNCVFVDNRSEETGGGACLAGYEPSYVVNTLFCGNTSQRGGGAYLWRSADLANCVFNANNASLQGGAVYKLYGNPTIRNCTIYGNTADNYAGIYAASYGSAQLFNTILYANSDYEGMREQAQLYLQSTDGLIIQSCCIQNWSGAYEGANVYSDDPLFVDADGADNVVGTIDDNLRLSIYSPYVDAGDNGLVMLDHMDYDRDGIVDEMFPIDFDDGERFVDIAWKQDTGVDTAPVVDLGPFETTDQPAIVVPQNHFAVPEGGSLTIPISLSFRPVSNVVISISLSGDENINLASGTVLHFDQDNYSEPQHIVVNAGKDADYVTGEALLTLSAPGVQSRQVFLVEQDDDPVLPVIFVDCDAPGTQTGQDWENAFTNLQEALTFATTYPEISEIRVAEGIYCPTGPNGERRLSFNLRNNLAIRGGYAGYGHGSADLRNWTVFKSVLSGDLNGDDGPTFANGEDNSYRVVLADGVDQTAVVDGVVVSGGRTPDNFVNTRGAGILCLNGCPQITNCLIENNDSRAVEIKDASHAAITSCVFRNNVVSLFVGKAYKSVQITSITLTDCTFESNTRVKSGEYTNYVSADEVKIHHCLFRGNSGGILQLADSEADISACSFEQNTGAVSIWKSHLTVGNTTFVENTQGYGGALYLENGHLEVAGCFFKNNSGMYGGAVHVNERDCSYSIRDCQFLQNSVTSLGGALFLKSSGRVEHCLFQGNESAGSGGAIHNDKGNSVVLNSVVRNNAAKDGGAVSSSDSPALLSLINCTVYGNTATGLGGGIRSTHSNGAYVVANSILWGNCDSQQIPERAQFSGTSFSISHCCVQGWTGQFGGEGNIGTDPCFLHKDLLGPADTNLRLNGYSPCIDAGDNSVLPADTQVDCDHNERFMDNPDANDTGTGFPPLIDMGAYEFQPDIPYIGTSPLSFYFRMYDPSVRQMTQALRIRNRGEGVLSWEIREDIPWLSVSSVAGESTGDTIEIELQVNAEGLQLGEYKGQFEIFSNDPVFSIRAIPVCLRYGPLRVPQEYDTIESAIQDAVSGDIIQLETGLYQGDGQTTISLQGKGVTIRSTDPNDASVVAATVIKGGGFDIASVSHSEARIEGITISGLGVTVDQSQCVLYNCTVADSGGIICRSSTCDLVNCTVRGCKGIYYYNTVGTVKACLVEQNASDSDGGGIECYGGLCNIVVEDSIIRGNTAKGNGGGIISRNKANVLVKNSRILGNSAWGGGGGVCCFSCNDSSFGYVTLIGCLVKNNEARSGGGLACFNGTAISCLIENNVAVMTAGLRDFTGDLVNCTIVNNASQESTGGVSHVRGTITNCIIASNQSPYMGEDAQINVCYSEMIVRNCCISGWTGKYRGTNIFSDSPLFENEQARDFRLRPESPYIDRAEEFIAPWSGQRDASGNFRYIDGDGDGHAQCDMGAYEHGTLDAPWIVTDPSTITFIALKDELNVPVQALRIHNIGPHEIFDWDLAADSRLTCVPARGTFQEDGIEVAVRIDIAELELGRHDYIVTISSDAVQNSPCLVNVVLYVYAADSICVPQELPDIQTAIDLAAKGALITIADGVYTGRGNRDIDLKGKAVTIRSENGPEACIIDCQGSWLNSGIGFFFRTGEGRDSVLDGVTIMNGLGLAGIDEGGGGIHIDGASPTIRNCVIKACSGDGGGGMYVSGTSGPVVENCTFIQNMHTSGFPNGGGGLCSFGKAVVTGCQFIGNRSFWAGGISCRGEIQVSRSTFVGNSENGVYNYGHLGLEACVFVGNKGCAVKTGGAIGETVAHTDISNCIISGNEPVDWRQPDLQLGGVIANQTVRYSCIHGKDVLTGIGNFNRPPLFIDRGYWDDSSTPDDATDDVWIVGDYHLQLDSPCIDAGDPNVPFGAELEPNGRRVNIGLYGNTAEAAITVDSDGDGYTNPLESRWGLDPHATDGDNDGLSDAYEIGYDRDSSSYDPYDRETGLGGDLNGSLADTDGDGLNDRDEIEVYHFRPLDPDMDKDGLLDGQEVIYNSDPYDSDTDDDDLPDKWEVDNDLNPTDSADRDADSDQDGLTNYEEFSLGLFANDADTDDDGMWDGWELENSLQPTTDDSGEDPDGDQLLNGDEFLHSCSPHDSDSDNDEMPDGWEVQKGLDPVHNDAAGDLDGDGLTNRDEFARGTLPDNADSDGDYMPDGWEVEHGLNPAYQYDASRDLDGDGYTNWFEFARGSSPDDEASVPQPTTLYVDDDAQNDPGPGDWTGTADHPFGTLHAAIDFAINYDAIMLEDGYYESPQWYPANVTKAGLKIASCNGPEHCVVDLLGSGAIVVSGTGVELEGLTVRNGTAGISTNSAGVKIVNCVLTECDDGLRILGGDAEVVHCSMVSNWCGIRAAHAGVTVENCTAAHNGGALHAEYSDVGLRNCLFYDNTSSFGDSAIDCRRNSSLDMVNCTIAASSQQWRSPAIDLDATTTAALRNSIIWGFGTAITGYSSTNQPVATYCDIEPAWAGQGNISEKPFFVDAANGDYRLFDVSPCINAGAPDEPVDADGVDVEGGPRLLQGRIDMGAYETMSADCTADGEVDFDDVARLASSWLEANCEEAGCGMVDFSLDGTVTVEDLGRLAKAWRFTRSGPAAWWRFDEATGDAAADSSMYRRDGTLLNTSGDARVDGMIGGGLLFDGVDDYASIDGWKGVGGRQPRTMCAWIKTSDMDGVILSWGTLGLPGGRWLLVTESGGRLRLEVGAGAMVGSTPVCDGQWHHVVAVLESGMPNVKDVRLYVDGELEIPSEAGDRMIFTVLHSADSTDVAIGAWPPLGRHFEGVVDEVRIYDRSLSAKEIRALAGN